MTAMDDAKELDDIAEKLRAMAGRFTRSHSGIYMDRTDCSAFPGLLIEIISLTNATLGRGNLQAGNMISFVNEYSGGIGGGPSLHAVEGLVGMVQAAAKEARRRAASAGAPKVATGVKPQYVAQSRIDELSAIPRGAWDLSKLLKLIEELNKANQGDSFYSVATLVRMIKDHVPPIFEAKNFGQVASSAGSSFKGNMENLERSLKHIADAHLHGQIGPSEALPNENQVDFKRDLDVLLAQIVKRLRAN